LLQLRNLHESMRPAIEFLDSGEDDPFDIPAIT
jgi:hypothetical protein